jgi:hypothetical protein
MSSWLTCGSALSKPRPSTSGTMTSITGRSTTRKATGSGCGCARGLLHRSTFQRQASSSHATTGRIASSQSSTRSLISWSCRPEHVCTMCSMSVSLKPFVGTPPQAPPALPPIHNGAAMPEQEHVLRSRLARGVRQLLVHWKGEPAVSATWEDADSFIDRYPLFQLEDELLVEGGRDVMWGRHYQRRSRTQAQNPRRLYQPRLRVKEPRSCRLGH